MFGCDSVEVWGPTWIANEQVATYTLEMEPYYSHVGATVFVVVQVPDAWTSLGWRYSGTVDGSPVSGTGTWFAGDPGNCSKPAVPTGSKRVWAEAGVFADLEPGRDHVTAELDFDVGVATGQHHLEFWFEVVDDGGVTCSSPIWEELDVHQWPRLEWEEVVGGGSPASPGLGGVPGKQWGRTVFNGFLYHIVEPEDENSEIWRTSDHVHWELVRTAAAAENAYELFVFQDRLMMLATHLPGGPFPAQWELWVSDNGVDWERSTVWTDRPIDVFRSTDRIGALLRRGELDAYEFFLATSTDGSSWSMIGEGPFIANPAGGASCGEAFDGQFYIGGTVDDGVGGFRPQLWRADGGTVHQVDTTPMLSGYSRFVMSMAVHEGTLALGTRADLGGEVWLFDGGGTWQQIGDQGLGLPGEGVVLDLVSHLGSLFALVWRSSDQRAQIWFADHTLTWSKSDLDNVTTNSFITRPSGHETGIYVASRYELWRRVLLFEDGFETQDTTHWSTVVAE